MFGYVGLFVLTAASDLHWMLGLYCTEQYWAHCRVYLQLLRHIVFAAQILRLSCNRGLQIDFFFGGGNEFYRLVFNVFVYPVVRFESLDVCRVKKN